MNRIPTEGLKLIFLPLPTIQQNRLNEQNPDRGIETALAEIEAGGGEWA